MLISVSLAIQKGSGNVIRVMTTLGDQQREDPDNYVP